MSEVKKSVFIKTYGCQMNVYDSDRMADILIEQGYLRTDKVDEADLVLLNTCHIREKAAEKVYSELGRFRPLKDAKPDLKIGVASRRHERLPPDLEALLEVELFGFVEHREAFRTSGLGSKRRRSTTRRRRRGCAPHGS